MAITNPYLGKITVLFTVLLLVTLLPACKPEERAMQIPIKTDYPQPKRHSTLLIMLPGINDPISRFEEFGLIAAAQQYAVDVLVVDSHFSYYKNRKLVERLEQDVLIPARRGGYKEIWLLGTSLGGFGGLLVEQQRPGSLDGLIMIAPFLGDNKVKDCVQTATPEHCLSQLEEAEVIGARQWKSLNSQGLDAIQSNSYLLFGSQDRFAPFNRLLADWIPDGQLVEQPGRHNWNTWARLWQNWLQQQTVFAPLPANARVERDITATISQPTESLWIDEID